MNINHKFLLLALFFFTSHLTIIAQKGDFSFTPTIGLNIPILDNGIGFHIGINPAYSFSSFVAVEAQVSLGHIKGVGAFLTGESSSQTSFNVLVGPRFYLLSEEKKARPYLNLLVGGMQNSESDYIEYTVGASVGGFVEINNFLLGVSAETPGNIIVKTGYVF